MVHFNPVQDAGLIFYRGLDPSGECNTFCPWNDEEPNNYEGTDEDGLEMVGTGLWNDQGPEATGGIVVEYNGMDNSNLQCIAACDCSFNAIKTYFIASASILVVVLILMNILTPNIIID